MKKQTMLYRVSYDEEKDAFETYFYVGTKKNPEWGDFKHESTCLCLRAWNEHKQEPAEEHEVVSYRLVTRIRQALDMGYRLEFKDKPAEE